MDESKIAGHLHALGLNKLEARVYVCLLSQPPMTAYGVARKLGVAAANVYKAVESLSARGAVLVESGDNRLCRAVPASEFLAHMEWAFRQRSKEASDALSKLCPPESEDGWYKLESVPQALQRAREMLGRAEKAAVVDAFPRVLAELLPAIRMAVKRGVEVLVQAYEPVQIAGAKVAVAATSAQSVRLWRSEQLNLAIDGRECIVALVDGALTRVHQGLWSQSVYLSCIVFAGLKSEHTIHRMYECLSGGDELNKLKKVLRSHRFFVDAEVPGQVELMRRYTAAPDAEEDR